MSSRFIRGYNLIRTPSRRENLVVFRVKYRGHYGDKVVISVFNERCQDLLRLVDNGALLDIEYTEEFYYEDGNLRYFPRIIDFAPSIGLEE